MRLGGAVYVFCYQVTLSCILHRRYRGVVVITTAKLRLTMSELRLCAGSNPAAAFRRPAMMRISDNGPSWK